MGIKKNILIGRVVVLVVGQISLSEIKYYLKIWVFLIRYP